MQPGPYKVPLVLWQSGSVWWGKNSFLPRPCTPRVRNRPLLFKRGWCLLSGCPLFVVGLVLLGLWYHTGLQTGWAPAGLGRWQICCPVSWLQQGMGAGGVHIRCPLWVAREQPVWDSQLRPHLANPFRESHPAAWGSCAWYCQVPPQALGLCRQTTTSPCSLQS